MGCCPSCGYVVNIQDAGDPNNLAFQNLGLIGVGMFDGRDGLEVNFRSVASGSNSLVITYDGVNHAAIFTLDFSLVVADLPQATTTQRGVGETASDAEAQGKASITTFLTPSNLAALGATQSFAGLAEFANDAETAAGASSTLAVTPAGLASVLSTLGNMVVFADAATRAGTAPQFAGQIGTQVDLFLPFVGAGTVAGDFNLPLLVLNSGNNVMTVSTSLDLSGQQFAFFNGELVVDGAASFDNGFVRFGNSSPSQVDFANNCTVYIGGAIVSANSNLITGGTNGELGSKLISEYLSSDNVQVGYAAFTNPATIRTLDTATATPQQIAQCLGTLISDLKNLLVPAT